MAMKTEVGIQQLTQLVAPLKHVHVSADRFCSCKFMVKQYDETKNNFHFTS